MDLTSRGIECRLRVDVGGGKLSSIPRSGSRELRNELQVTLQNIHATPPVVCPCVLRRKLRLDDDLNRQETSQERSNRGSVTSDRRDGGGACGDPDKASRGHPPNNDVQDEDIHAGGFPKAR